MSTQPREVRPEARVNCEHPECGTFCSVIDQRAEPSRAEARIEAERGRVAELERARIAVELYRIIPPPWGPSDFWDGWAAAAQAVEVNFDPDLAEERTADWGAAERTAALDQARREGAEKALRDAADAVDQRGGWSASYWLRLRADAIAAGIREVE